MNETKSTVSTADIAALRDSMLRFAHLQLRDDAAAEDAVQEALAAALSSSGSFDGRASLKTWVFSILRHKIVDLIRSQSRSINASALAEEGAGFDETFDALFRQNAHWTPAATPRDWGDPEKSFSDRQFWRVFDACLDHLPANTARVFMMREFLELDTAEICQELSISSDNCYVILHRARNRLRLCLDAEWFAEGAS